MKKVLALNEKGELTYCTAPPELRGRGRCNHIGHQEDNESVQEFIVRISDLIGQTGGGSEDIPDQQEKIIELIKENQKAFNKNPDWEAAIMSIPNPFHIGKDENYEEATIVSVEQIEDINEFGDEIIRLKVNLEFDGKEYQMDFGDVPKVLDDGTIQMNGSKFRVLPILSQLKSGIVRYRDASILRTKDGHVIAKMTPGEDFIEMRGEKVNIDDVQDYLQTGNPKGLTKAQMLELDKIDPVVYQRYPHFNEDMRSVINDHVPDQPNDLSWRKVLTYEDQVLKEMRRQSRRMGNTFRANLKKKRELEAEGKFDEANDVVLFYQANLSSNIRKDLANQSNVQVADNLNPLAALSQAHKISLTGPGGFNKDAAPILLRQVHESHRGKIDSLDVSSGKNVGLTISLHNSDIDEQGFIVESNKGDLAVSDFIPYAKHNDINRAVMAVAHMKQAVPLVGGNDPKLVGDSSDHAWSKIKGSKLGVTLNVAYLPTEGTHEDSVVISESAAKKMQTKETNNYIIDRTIKNKSGREFKQGDFVERGEIVHGTRVKYRGVIKEISGNNMKIESTFDMTPGDKIAGRHGNKGVVGRVIPDDEMPLIDKGNGRFEKAEILMSPMGVVGRMNLGQIYETNSGDFNKKTVIKTQSGHDVIGTAGEQFIMRLNHHAEKKMQSYSNQLDSSKEPMGMRAGEMESLLMSSTEGRRQVLEYIRHQETSDTRNKLNSLLKASGVDLVIREED